MSKPGSMWKTPRRKGLPFKGPSQPAGWRNGARVTGDRINEEGRKRRVK